MRTGGSTGALNLSPSMLSLDSAYEFDQGLSLPPRSEAQHHDQGGVFEPSENGSGAVWTTVEGAEHNSMEPDMRRRHRETIVMYGGTETTELEDFIRTLST
jgi:predicted deacylase